MSTHICPPIVRFCKRGHLRTEATTFARKAKIGGKTYIVRECRQCHSERNKTPSKTGRRNRSKYAKVPA